ncbi:MAG: hypothetical protein LLG43_06165 [Deltaproteobacteria bacterium]|nr:hypothetical protein [Deltaproteobacteria bacterium]
MDRTPSDASRYADTLIAPLPDEREEKRAILCPGRAAAGLDTIEGTDVPDAEV